MTWIIGGNTFEGFCFSISDIKVSWVDSSDRVIDSVFLQKFYPITNRIGIGFAGSVGIGLRIIDKFIRNSNEHKELSIPEVAISKIQKTAIYEYEKAKPEEKRLQSEIIVLGITSKTEDQRLPFSQASTYVAVMKSSEMFKPSYAKPTEFLSIGSGSYTHRELVKWLNEEKNKVLGFSYGQTLLTTLLASDELRQRGDQYCSKYMQVFNLSNEGFRYSTNETQNEDGTYNNKMPRITVGLAEFNKFCKKRGYSGIAAIG